MAQSPQRVRRRERKNITAGVAHVNASFNNTMITITRCAGQCDQLVFGRHDGLQGVAQVDAVRRPGCRRGRRSQGGRTRRAHAGGRGEGSGFGPRKRPSGLSRRSGSRSRRSATSPRSRTMACVPVQAPPRLIASLLAAPAPRGRGRAARTDWQGVTHVLPNMREARVRQREKLAGTEEAQRAGASPRR